MAEIKIMFVADLCGQPGRQAAAHLIKPLKEEYGADYVICNVENAAGGFGVTPEMSKKIFSYGVDMQTSGNHIWDRQDIIRYLQTNPKLLRPANYPKNTPGLGFKIDEFDGYRIGVVNLMGRAFMKDIDCPFKAGKKIIDQIKLETNIIFVDFHAEATAEKQAFKYFADGKVSVIVGTHTHVPTADEHVTPNGTAYISDAGMTGGYESVIGMHIKPSLDRFLTGMPIRFTPATEDVRIAGIIATVDVNSGKATHIERYQVKFDINNLPKTERESLPADEGK